ncbi:MAG: hypothetical protein AB7Y46_05180 [Armatimonadota bacterium]
MDVALMRELVDGALRPGQPGGSLTVDRAPAAAALAPRGHAGGNRWDWATQTNRSYAVYGRGRYGRSSYGHA